MNPSGVFVVSCFAAIWAMVGLVLAGSPAWMVIGPIAVSAGLVLASSRITQPTLDPAQRRRLNRLVGIASAVEGVAILVAVNVLAWIGRGDLSAAVVAVIVGLHFIPLAMGMRVRLYWATMAGLVLAGVGGALFLPAGAPRDVVICSIAAGALWLTAAIGIVSRLREASSR